MIIDEKLRNGFIIVMAFSIMMPLYCRAEDRQLPGHFAGDGIVVGLEYAVLDNPALVKGMAEAYAETGMTGMKHYPEAVQWGEMQKGPNAPIDFTVLDLFVREYQRKGFTELTLCLKPHSAWASVHVPKFGKYTNPSPKPEYRELFAKWISAVVERYDADGIDDMPQLRWPVRYIEIGSEFSSYEPEPVDEYLQTLGIAYKAAHQASENVMVGHVAFLITPVNLDVKSPNDYEKAWQKADIRDMHHGLADQRKILDHPQLFDFINFHNLGEPYEIEHIMKWLKYETKQRGYTKPVVIGDTVPTSYIGWGPATICKGQKLGTISLPAKESDRCRLAKFFTKLVNKDRSAVAWTRGFIAADQVQRTIIAAEQGIKLINLSFTGDLPLLTLPFFKAGAGLSAWGGAIRVEMRTGRALEKYPLFYAIKQLMGHFNGYDSIERIRFPDERARVYLVNRKGKKFWVAWFNPKAAILPEDGDAGINIVFKINTGSSYIIVEPVITTMGEPDALRRQIKRDNGTVDIRLTHTPVYIFEDEGK
jgi:hypothetical protein